MEGLLSPGMFGVVAGIFSALLIATGVAKLTRPHETARALAEVGVPQALPATYLLAGTEVMVGGAALVAPHRFTLAAQTTMYLVFLAWVVIALKRDVPLASCGCLGRDDTPPYWGHVVLNVLAITASGAAMINGADLWALSEGLARVTNITMVAGGAWLAWQVMGAGAVAARRQSA